MSYETKCFSRKCHDSVGGRTKRASALPVAPAPRLFGRAARLLFCRSPARRSMCCGFDLCFRPLAFRWTLISASISTCGHLRSAVVENIVVVNSLLKTLLQIGEEICHQTAILPPLQLQQQPQAQLMKTTNCSRPLSIRGHLSSTNLEFSAWNFSNIEQLKPN